MKKEAIQIICENIINVKADIIVNAANDMLKAGGGVCGAIFRAAGYSKLQEACDKIGHCPTGKAVMTSGFDLCPHIIHAVGPIYKDGQHNEKELLESCYKDALDLALKHECHSICFPLISAGIYGYPLKEAWQAALASCLTWLKQHDDYSIEIIFAVLDERIRHLGQAVLNEKTAA